MSGKWTFDELRDIPARDRALEIICYAKSRRFPTTVTVVDHDNQIIFPKIEAKDQRPGERWIPCECSEDGHMIVGALVVAVLREQSGKRSRARRVDVNRVSRSRRQT